MDPSNSIQLPHCFVFMFNFDGVGLRIASKLSPQQSEHLVPGLNIAPTPNQNCQGCQVTRCPGKWTPTVDTDLTRATQPSMVYWWFGMYNKTWAGLEQPVAFTFNEGRDPPKACGIRTSHVANNFALPMRSLSNNHPTVNIWRDGSSTNSNALAVQSITRSLSLWDWRPPQADSHLHPQQHHRGKCLTLQLYTLPKNKNGSIISPPPLKQITIPFKQKSNILRKKLTNNVKSIQNSVGSAVCLHAWKS